MEHLRHYLNTLTTLLDRHAFARAAGTTLNYLRCAISRGKKFDVKLCVAIDKASGGAVTFRDVRPDVEWDYIARRVAEGA